MGVNMITIALCLEIVASRSDFFPHKAFGDPAPLGPAGDLTELLSGG